MVFIPPLFMPMPMLILLCNDATAGDAAAMLFPNEDCRCCCGAPGGGARLNPDNPPPPLGAIVGGGGRENDEAARCAVLFICPRDMPPKAFVGGAEGWEGVVVAQGLDVAAAEAVLPQFVEPDDGWRGGMELAVIGCKG